MKRNLFLIYFILLIGFMPSLRADEGMWIPMLIEKLNIRQMHEMGFKLTAEDIYSVNHASMKDAVMIFGGGCTAELISGEGLLITNHHCGYRSIQSHSSVEHDYLTNGFWAMSRKEELTNAGLTVKFLKWMDEVTPKVLEGVNRSMTDKERSDKINENISAIIKEAVKGTHYTAHVEPFFQGNQYFIFVEQTFRDVRLVGAPPSAIGKFGGDTDNWMWPRHTGDFSLFRIYADKNNQPAEYSPKNVPYKPASFFPISLKGVHPGDFTMVFGYPGSTYEYVPSYHLKMLMQDIYPKLIDIRGRKLEIMNEDMGKNPEVRIQYAAKNASISNSWKRWKGEIRGLKSLNAQERKKAFEKRFQVWSEETPEGKDYRNVLSGYKSFYSEYTPYRFAREYAREVFYRNGAELVTFSGKFTRLIQKMEHQVPREEMVQVTNNLKKEALNFYKNYNLQTDKKLFVNLLKMYAENAGINFQPSFYINIHSKYKDNYEKYMDFVYGKTLFTDSSRVFQILRSPKMADMAKIKKDPIYLIFQSADNLYKNKIMREYNRLGLELNRLNRIYMDGQMTFQPDKVFYSDANFTLRLAYGEVKGYVPRDAVSYKYYTTLKGIIEKDNPAIYDYDLPVRLKELYNEKDYGKYAENGEMHVCFLATNHTTGGNSGSPVLNAEGQLIGINFDRAWEGVMSDLMFNPDQCRNISLDIRYALFLIDKFAGAGYLLDEMKILE